MVFNPLYIVWNFNPVLFSVGGLDIRYYGLMWALAILVGAKFFDNFCKREGLPSSVSESIFIYGTLATILGARLGHCLFYDTMEYLSKPWTIITGFRDGGMASHGAAIGLLIGLWLFSRRNKLPYIWSLDRIMIPVGIGGAIVRLGNLFNSEIFGQATTLPWGFEFVRSHKWVAEFAPAAVHPTQIYEALCYLATFGILCWLYYRRDIARRRPGILFGIGLIGTFLTRFFIEYIKTEQEPFEVGWALDMGQWLSIPFILLGIYMIWRGATRPGTVPAPGRSSAGLPCRQGSAPWHCTAPRRCSGHRPCGPDWRRPPHGSRPAWRMRRKSDFPWADPSVTHKYIFIIVILGVDVYGHPLQNARERRKNNFFVCRPCRILSYPL